MSNEDQMAYNYDLLQELKLKGGVVGNRMGGNDS